MEVLVATATCFRDPMVHYALAIRYFSLKRFDLAATYFRKLGPAVARTPHHYREFAISLANSDQWDEALNHAERNRVEEEKDAPGFVQNQERAQPAGGLASDNPTPQAAIRLIPSPPRTAI